MLRRQEEDPTSLNEPVGKCLEVHSEQWTNHHQSWSHGPENRNTSRRLRHWDKLARPAKAIQDVRIFEKHAVDE